MSKSKKPIYKIKFEVEIEITKEVTKTNLGEDRFGFHQKVDTKKIANDFDTNNPIEERIADRLDYIEQHFPDVIRDSFAILFHLEGPAVNTSYSDAKSKTRKAVLEATKRMTDQTQRQRLKTTRGPQPDKSKSNYEKERAKFLDECVDALKNLKIKKVPINPKNLAKQLYEYNDDARRKLKRKMDLYGTTFEQLKKMSQ